MPINKFVPKEKRKKYQISDGRFERRITLPDGTKKTCRANSMTELQEKIDKVMDDAKKGVVISDKSTLDQWSDTWFKVYKADVRYYTTQMYLSMYSKHISPLIGNRELKSINPVDIQIVMNEASKWEIKNRKSEVVKSGESSESLLRKVYITLSQLFQTALENHLIATNPCIGIKVKKVEPSSKKKTLSKEQQNEILEKIKLTRAYVFVALGMYLGLRREESTALRWTDIDWKKGHVKIQRTATFENNLTELSPLTKSASGKREIPILPPLLTILNECNPTHSEIAITKVKYRVKDGYDIREIKSIYLCPSKDGDVMTKSSYKRMWEVVTKRVSFKVTSHMLRHTYCTMLHKAGIDIRTAQYLMGDSDLKTVAKVYTHIENDQIENADKKLRSLFKKSTTKSTTGDDLVTE